MTDRFLLNIYHILYLGALISFVIALYVSWNNWRAKSNKSYLNRRYELIFIAFSAFLSFGGFILSHANLNQGWTWEGTIKVIGAYWLSSWFWPVLLSMILSFGFSFWRVRINPFILPIVLFTGMAGLIVLDIAETRTDNINILNQIEVMKAYSLEYDNNLMIFSSEEFEKNSLGECVGCANVLNERWVEKYYEAYAAYSASRPLHPQAITYPSINNKGSSFSLITPHSYFKDQSQYFIYGILVLGLMVVVFNNFPRLKMHFEQSYILVGYAVILLSLIAFITTWYFNGIIPGIYFSKTRFYSVTDLLKVGLVIYLAGFLASRYQLVENQLKLSYSRPWYIGIFFSLLGILRSYSQAIVIVAVPVVISLLLQDWGGMALMIGLTTIMLFLGSGRHLRSQILVTSGLFVVIIFSPLLPSIVLPAVNTVKNILKLETKFEAVQSRVEMWQCPIQAYQDADSTEQLRESYINDIIGGIKERPRPLAPLVSERIDKVINEINYQVDQRLETKTKVVSAPRYRDELMDAILLESSIEIMDRLQMNSTFIKDGQYKTDKLLLADLAHRTTTQLQEWGQQFEVRESNILGNHPSDYNLPELYPAERFNNYQLVMAFYALKAGDVFGVGLGNGKPNTIPNIDTDFIFVGWLEATGWIGGISLLGVICLLMLIALWYAKRQRTIIRQLLISGLAVILALEVIAIVGGNTGMLPLTGIIMPFMSRSGSSLLVYFFLAGLILSYTGESSINFEQESSERGTGQQINKSIYSLTIVLVILFVVTSGFMLLRTVSGVNLSLGNCNSYGIGTALPYDPHSKQVLRGKILTAYRDILADSSADTLSREYPADSYLYSHIIDQVEYGYNRVLTGDFNGQIAQGKGYTVVTTIDPNYQEVLHNALISAASNAGIPVDQLRAAGVVMDVSQEHAGAILAMDSLPNYKMGMSRDEKALLEVEDRNSPTGPLSRLLNRAIQGAYPPGSTYKIVTASTAIDIKSVKPTDTFDLSPFWIGNGIHVYKSKGTLITDPNCGDYNNPTLTESFAFSCNSVFAMVAERIGAKRLVEYDRRFGFETDINFGRIYVKPSIIDNTYALPLESRDINKPNILLDTGYGQGELLVTPLHMTMIAASIALGGNMPDPYLVQRIESDDSMKIMEQAKPHIHRVITQSTANQMSDMMRAVVNEQFGSGRLILNYQGGDRAALKTGTAEWGNTGGKPHAWVVGFWPADKPQIAFTILIEQGGSGAEVAVPAAGVLLEAFDSQEAPQSQNK